MNGKKRGGRRLVKILGGLLLFGVLAAFLLMMAVFWMERHLPPEGDAEAILILGAQVKPDGTPSLALERRMTAALEAYREKPRLVVCCGGQGGNEPLAEGDLMCSWMMAHGCREENVLAETASVNTRENLVNAKEIMDERGLTRALIVTSDYHVPRALALAAQVGLQATGRGSPSKPEYFVKNHLREGLSWIKFLIETWRKSA